MKTGCWIFERLLVDVAFSIFERGYNFFMVVVNEVVYSFSIV